MNKIGINNSKGYGLIEILIILAVITIPFMAAMEFNLFLNKKSRQMADVSEIKNFKQTLVNLVSTRSSWLATIGKNPSMGCLKDGQGESCPAGKQRTKFALYSEDSVLYYDSTDNQKGVTIQGFPCTGYPSINCPLRYELEWAAMTNDPFPIVAVLITLQVGQDSQGRPYTDLVINPASYSHSVPLNSWPPPKDQWPTNLIYISTE